ncbi:F-box domain-containing protein [Mycena venus]|uniref:F-box domain-containing protein n=1 Tax=Mycena venus TaxID=2733690 RepID=A0A8H6X4Z8_9AGAR|nr:F-box domain-containing protein [Mycena venus]
MLSAKLEADRARAADLEVEILRLEHYLSALRIEKAQIQERLDSYKYPVLTLPTEITSEIFLHFVPDYPNFPPAHRSPLADFFDPNMSRVARNCSGHPGTLLDAYDDPEVIALVVPYRMQWEHLELNLPSSFLAFIDGPMPLLRHLEVALEDCEDPVPVTFMDVPRLCTVLLNDYAAASVILPWWQLTSLVLDRVYPHECTPVLQQTSDLVYCELRLYHDDTVEVPDIKLLRLESLVLKDPGPYAVTDYLNTLLVPNLRSLEVPERFLGTKPIESLTFFITTSGCTLQDLRITGQRSVTEASYYEAFSSVRKFFFTGNYVGSFNTVDEEASSASDSSDEGNSDLE